MDGSEDKLVTFLRVFTFTLLSTRSFPLQIFLISISRIKLKSYNNQLVLIITAILLFQDIRN